MKQSKSKGKSLGERFGIPSVTATDNRSISFRDADPRLLAAAIAGAVDCGDALILGRTRDGGAVVITVLSGTDSHKFYAGNQGELEDNLNLLRRGYGIDPVRTDVPDDKVG